MPDYALDPNAVLKDVDAAWRYGNAPDYSKTRKYFDDSKCASALTSPGFRICNSATCEPFFFFLSSQQEQ